MKLIILAAGKGNRLKPFTDSIPKCMVKFNNKPIIKYILEVANSCNIKDIAIVGGYKFEKLKNYLANEQITYLFNKNFEKSNMVSSLFCAKEFMNDDIIISYSDIIYKKEILEKVITSKADFSVVVDKKWKELWKIRMENPLDDAETLKIRDNKIIELGKKPQNYAEIEGQYIGLIKISKEKLPVIIDYYKNLDRDKLYDGKDFENIYMTSFIQLIINNILNVTPILINGGWLEIDSVEDLNNYNTHKVELQKLGL